MPPTGLPLTRLALRSLRTVDLSLPTMLDPARLAASAPQAVALLARFRPAAIYTTGGYVAIPVLLAAAALRIPVLLWEGNVIPGRSVRATGRLARVRAVSFAATCARLPEPCYATGTPIRSLGGAERGAARARFGLDDLPCVLVFGGSQEVRTFNRAVAACLSELLTHAALIHVTGEPGHAAALRQRDALPAALRERYRPFPFLREEMTDALLAADLVVGRAGSSTLAEVTALGLPMVVVPYPHAAAHQAANARQLVETGAAVLVRDEAFDGTALLAAAELLHDPARRERMGRASRALGRPGAAAANAELVLALAEGRPLPSAERIERLARTAA